MEDHPAANAMAAAIAAAAELAKNGGMTLFDAVPQRIGEETDSLHKPSPLKENAPSNEKVCSSEDKSDSYSSGAMLDTDNDEDMDGEEDAEKRLARSRERNREHARRTRLRKKAQLEGLQTKVKGLEAEGKLLRQSIEECSIASILVGLSSGDETKSVTDSLLSASDLDSMAKPKVSLVVGGKRKRFISDDNMEKPPQPLKLNIDGQITLIGGGKTHINWKSGVYCDDNGSQRKLTQDQLESLRYVLFVTPTHHTRDRNSCLTLLFYFSILGANEIACTQR